MFAYCNNNPVMHIDTTGNVVVSFSAIQEYGSLAAAITYAGRWNNEPQPSNEGINRETAHASEYNCYGNAVGRANMQTPNNFNQNILGTYTGEEYLNSFYMLISSHVGPQNVRSLASITDPINEDENLVVLNAGKDGFHLVVRIDGVWHNKPGNNKLEVSWTFPYGASDTWIDQDQIYYYGPIYFAIKKAWWLS